MNAPSPDFRSSDAPLATGRSLVADADAHCPLPSLSRHDPDFRPDGAYWRGSVWLPTAYMAIKAVGGAGDGGLARRLASELIAHMAATYRDFAPHTVWECYSPAETRPGTYGKKSGYSRPDFCGWSALGPISLFIEDVIGVRQADAFQNRLVCDFPAALEGRVGVLNYRFGDVVCDIVATKDALAVDANRPFALVADGKNLDVRAGLNVWSRPGFDSVPAPGDRAAPDLLSAAREGAAGRFPPGDWRAALPRPVCDGRQEWIDLYWKAWELARAHVVTVPGLPQPRYMDCGHRSDRIWIWDTCFMALFCKYAPREFPGVESLENFYSLVLDGYDKPLPKVIGNRWCGADEGKSLDFMVHHADNPPLFAWVELLYALQTGDRARLEKVYAEKRWLPRWYDLFESFDPAAPTPRGVSVPIALKRVADGYRWAGCPSGMDNTPRGRTADHPSGDPGRCPDNPGLLWIDALAQQGLSAICLSRIASVLGRDSEAEQWRARWAELRVKANSLYWDEMDGFYYDILESDRGKVKVPTLASYWPMLARMATPSMEEALLAKLRDPRAFG